MLETGGVLAGGIPTAEQIAARRRVLEDLKAKRAAALARVKHKARKVRKRSPYGLRLNLHRAGEMDTVVSALREHLRGELQRRNYWRGKAHESAPKWLQRDYDDIRETIRLLRYLALREAEAECK
jgi:hypothetical protein